MEHKRMSDRPTRLTDAFEYLETIVGVEGLSLTEGRLLLKQQFLTHAAGWKRQIRQSPAPPGSVSNPVAVWTRKAEESCKVRNRANAARRLRERPKISDVVDFREATHHIAEIWRTLWETSRKNVHLPCGKAVLALLCGASSALAAQTTTSRLARGIESNSAVELHGSLDPRAAARFDIGSTDPATQMSGITMHFSLTSEQKAALDALVKAQQTPGSGYYHKWLTPAGYASRFGLSDSDLAKVQRWLEQQGFTVNRISNSHTSISFSGTVSQVQSAFQTEIHNYRLQGKTYFANAKPVSVPSGLSGVVGAVRNLSSFRPRAMVRFRSPLSTSAKREFTSSQSGDHYLDPDDVATIYDINAAYSAGYTGTGQSIAVVGQSEIELADIEHFQSALGWTTFKDPTTVLVPDSGSAAVSSGDEAESDLDLEYSGGIAKGATIYLVYTGDGSNYNVWDSLQYAVDTDIAPIISMSYGGCEPDLSSSDYSTLESIMQQGASQGQSIIVASGDMGSTACYADLTTNSTPTSEEEELAVNYPASSAYATALGGTEFPSADVSSSNTTYWESASGNDVITSALSYIPEQVWNDDSATYGEEDGAEYALSAGGGGTSTLTARPSWQSGAIGGVSISSGSYRMVPDISLDSSPNNAGYLYCSSDSSATDITGSCSDGFRDSSDDYLTVAGGTSFAAPIFAGMLAIINQKENSTGQGLINSTLYALAANSTTYASAFHDITSGSNECTAGSSYCSSAGESEYPAKTGYDEASGLGSVDLYNLMTSWTAGSSASLEATATALSAASTTPSSGASDLITITVSSQSSSITATPTGTLTIAVDGTSETSSLALSSGSATYTFSSTTSGSHVITATYSGDSKFAASTGTVTVDVAGSSTSSTGSFTLSPTNVTVSQGSSGTSTVTITSQDSYAGTIKFSLSTSSTSLQDYGCYSIGNSDSEVSVTANSTTTAALTIYTSESDCSSESSSVTKGRARRFISRKAVAAVPGGNPLSRRIVPVSAAAIAGFLLVGMRRKRSVLSSILSCLILLLVVGASLGCGSSTSGSSSSTSTDVAKGTYTLTLGGTDASDSSIASSTTLTLTVD
jgi:subtilase family serine protease